MRLTFVVHMQVYSYKDTMLRSPSSVNFPLINAHSDGKIM